MSRVCLLSLLAVCLAATLFAADPEPAVTDKSYLPLDGKHRLDHYLHQTFLDPGLYFASLGAAVGGQLANDPPEWHQGLKGYSKRAASLFGMFSLQAGIHEGGAAALHLDPRYIRSGGTGFFRRFGHAILWTFITYDDNRHIRPNLPIVAGAYGSGMISTLWYPARYDPLTDGVRTGNQQMGFSVGVNVVKEFAPELKRVFRMK